MSYLVYHPHRAVFALYRALLRESGRLPHHYLRVFYRTKFRDDLQPELKFDIGETGLSPNKLKRLSTNLKKLRAANAGNKKAFEYILDLAYGRRGKLKWELLEPFLVDSDITKPSRLIANVDRSRPPVYPPSLIALLTSPYSRKNKALKPESLQNPPTLPPRSDPASEERHLLGPLSRRRHANILWRYFSAETKKILPPLHVSVSVLEDSRTTDSGRSGDALKGTGLQEVGILEDLEILIGPDRRGRRSFRRQQDPVATNGSHEVIGTAATVTERKHLPTRYLRRRHQELLGRLPMLQYRVGDADYRAGRKGKFGVSYAPKAISHSLRNCSDRLTEVDEMNMVWIKRAEQ